jgi:nucleotide-binding universal stress UspA family protein
MIFVDSQGWEAVVRGAARYLFEGEATVACVVDERAAGGYGLSVRGLLGRRPRPHENLEPVSETEAEKFLSEAAGLLSGLRPGLSVGTLVLKGLPNERLVEAATERDAEAVFIGRGSPGADRPETISGFASGEWRRNHHDDPDGFYLEDGTEVRFPPHRAAEVGRVVGDGGRVEVWGTRRGRHFHAFEVKDPESGEKVEAHKPPGRGLAKVHLGHTARFVVDHVPCDVVLIG